MEAIEAVIPKYQGGMVPASRTYFPSISEYSSILETHGLEVRFAQLFDRPTPLEGVSGMETWLQQFKWYYFEPLPPAERQRALAEVIEMLRPRLWDGEKWIVDYRRLRLIAVKR
jgi:hypothetical protein